MFQAVPGEYTTPVICAALALFLPPDPAAATTTTINIIQI
jgi:hypothetical protein